MDLSDSGNMPDTAPNAELDVDALAASPRVAPHGGYLPPMISYAQNFEDVMLRRALQEIECGYYIDIGAADPEIDSVTCHFYRNGWRGINIEPDPSYFTKLQEHRPNDVNLQCVVGASSTNAIFSVATPGGISTGSTTRLAELAQLPDVTTTPILLPAITLEQVFALTGRQGVDFLKIDAEGMEDEILSGASFITQRPRIVVAEATCLNRQISSHQSWEPKLIAKGYKLAWFDGLNRFYLRDEDEWRLGLFKVPPCIFDNFFAVTIRSRVAEAAGRAAGDEAGLTNALAAANEELSDVKRQTGETAERDQATLSAASAETALARAELADIQRQMVEAGQHHEAALSEANERVEVAQARVADLHQELAETVEGYEARLSEAIARATDAGTRVASLEDELRQTAADAERYQAEFDKRINELTAKLASRNEDYRRIQQRLIEMEASRRRVLENLHQRERDCRHLQEHLERREHECRQFEADLSQRARECRQAQDDLSQREREYRQVQDDLVHRLDEIARLVADRDQLAAEKHRWLEAALPPDRDRLHAKQQFPFQSALYRSRIWSWLAAGLRRRRRLLTAAAKRARSETNWALAARYYRELLDLVPDRAGLWVLYGNALKESGRLDAAERAYRTSVGIDAAIADTHLQLGHALKLQGRLTEAMEAYQRALALDPGSPYARQELQALRG